MLNPRVKKLSALTLIMIAASVTCPSPLFAQSNDVLNRISRLENEIDTLNRAVYRGEKPPAPPPYVSASGKMDAGGMEVRLQQLESQIRDLTGRIEQQGFEIEQVNQRLDKMEMMASRPPDIGAAQAPMPTQQTPPPIVSPQSTALPQIDNPSIDYGYKDSSAGTPSPQDQPGITSMLKTATPQKSNDAAGLYEQAFAALKTGDYETAEKGFDDFIKTYPDHALTANAVYWLGETYYVRQKYDQAAKIFAEAYQKTPGGPKAPDNLLKLGMSLAGMGKTKEACVVLGQLKREYPNGPGPILQRGEQEWDSLDCR